MITKRSLVINVLRNFAYGDTNLTSFRTRISFDIACLDFSAAIGSSQDSQGTERLFALLI
jgi:hypothetical protein